MSDRSAQFQAIHDTYRPRILRYLTRLVGQADAEDLTQDVLIKVSNGLRQFRGESGLSTWIYRIATNTAIDNLRGSSARATHGEEYGMAATESDPDTELERGSTEASAPSVEAGVIRGEMSRCVREFVDRLPENYRTVMVLSELEGFSNAEIGEIMGLSLDTVKIRLHRAREKLRRDLSTGCSFHRDERNEFACDRRP